jgi:two-component system response regulator AtoC
MTLADSDLITVESLPPYLRHLCSDGILCIPDNELSIKKTMRQVEEMLIRRALAKTAGNRTQAAKRLEISHRALLYKIKDYDIDM